MPGKLMAGFWRLMLSVPPSLWQKQIAKEKKKLRAELAFMTADHRAVHHFIVRELPRLGEPISPELVAERLRIRSTIATGTVPGITAAVFCRVDSGLSPEPLSLPIERVKAIFDDLEKHMTFICRNEDGMAVWAYPVTVEKTPHRLTFSTGERIHAAWAIDAFATPFVQGRLREESLSVEIESKCAHCGKPMHISLDSNLNYRIDEEGCKPLIFVPEVNFSKLEDKCIIHAFWNESVFLWSEEHAREYRRREHRIRGVYFTADQAVFVTRIIQSELFGFENE